MLLPSTLGRDLNAGPQHTHDVYTGVQQSFTVDLVWTQGCSVDIAL